MPQRLALIVLLATATTLQAAPKSKQSTPQTALQITPAALMKGMAQYIQEEGDCRSVTFGKVRTLKNGAVIRQKLTREDAEIDMSLDVNKAGAISNLRLQSDTKDPAHLTVMLCATYAAMRTLQPAVERPETVRAAALDLWQQAQQKTYTKTLNSAQWRAQMVPFELNAF